MIGSALKTAELLGAEGGGGGCCVRAPCNRRPSTAQQAAGTPLDSVVGSRPDTGSGQDNPSQQRSAQPLKTEPGLPGWERRVGLMWGNSGLGRDPEPWAPLRVNSRERPELERSVGHAGNAWRGPRVWLGICLSGPPPRADTAPWPPSPGRKAGPVSAVALEHNEGAGGAGVGGRALDWWSFLGAGPESKSQETPRRKASPRLARLPSVRLLWGLSPRGGVSTGHGPPVRQAWAQTGPPRTWPR